MHISLVENFSLVYYELYSFFSIRLNRRNSCNTTKIVLKTNPFIYYLFFLPKSLPLTLNASPHLLSITLPRHNLLFLHFIELPPPLPSYLPFIFPQTSLIPDCPPPLTFQSLLSLGPPVLPSLSPSSILLSFVTSPLVIFLSH